MLAQGVARQLNSRCLLAEPASKGGRELRRGFVLRPAERVLVVDDVLTTGLSLQETLGAIKPYHSDIASIEVLIDRSGGWGNQQVGVAPHGVITVSARAVRPAPRPPGNRGGAVEALR